MCCECWLNGVVCIRYISNEFYVMRESTAKTKLFWFQNHTERERKWRRIIIEMNLNVREPETGASLEIGIYRKNCGPSIPIAWEVWPQTRNVNSFSMGSGSVCWKRNRLDHSSWMILISRPLTIGIFSKLSDCSNWERFSSVNKRRICCESVPNAPSSNWTSWPLNSDFKTRFSCIWKSMWITLI